MLSSQKGQKYEPVDSEQLSSYREDKSGQVLEEGITEAGAMSSWIAAGTSYSNHNIEMIPIYLFYSMFDILTLVPYNLSNKSLD